MTTLAGAFSGVSMLIQVEIPSASGTFKTVGGMTTNGGSIDAGQFDTTTKDGSRWQRSITGGILKMAISGAGKFVDDGALAYMHSLIISNADALYRLISANGDIYQGRFFLKSFGRTGAMAAEEFSLSLESNGTITYTAPAPTVTSAAPTAGAGTIPAAGGTAVTILGTKFQLGATVLFDTTPATSVVVVDQNTITCVSPAHAAGAVTVSVTNLDAQVGTKATAITYV